MNLGPDTLYPDDAQYNAQQAAITLAAQQAASAIEDVTADMDRLDLLVTMGLNLARLVHDTADRFAAADLPEAAKAVPKLLRAFDRTSRTVRQTLALKARLRDGALRRADHKEVAAKHRTAARRQIIRKLEDAIAREADPREQDHLLQDLHERLADPALDEDLIVRDLNDIVADLQQDLGIAVPPTARPRSPADIDRLNRRAAAPPQPLATVADPFPSPAFHIHAIRDHPD